MNPTAWVVPRRGKEFKKCQFMFRIPIESTIDIHNQLDTTITVY